MMRWLDHIAQVTREFNVLHGSGAAAREFFWGLATLVMLYALACAILVITGGA